MIRNVTINSQLSYLNIIFQYYQGNLISGGNDITVEFDWIHDNEKRTRLLEKISSFSNNVTHH